MTTTLDRGKERAFYDHYHLLHAPLAGIPSNHHRRLACRLRIGPRSFILDIGCGTGGWLAALAESGARATGVDLSIRAAQTASSRGITNRICIGLAEDLPFPSHTFDLVSCLGVLEHLPEPADAIVEMVRVARPDSRFLFLVPNARFLARTLGLYRGTEQVLLREEPRTIDGWKALFDAAGLDTLEHWVDRHILSWRWIMRKRAPGRTLLRSVGAILVALLPLSLTYQFYFLCRPRPNGTSPSRAE